MLGVFADQFNQLRSELSDAQAEIFGRDTAEFQPGECVPSAWPALLLHRVTIGQTLQGSFSVVSMPNFASK